jgi:hypothetical protein
MLLSQSEAQSDFCRPSRITSYAKRHDEDQRCAEDPDRLKADRNPEEPQGWKVGEDGNTLGLVADDEKCRAFDDDLHRKRRDEPSLGLAPKVTAEILETLARLNREGLSVLLVEQKAPLALKLASRVYVVSNGRVSAQIDPREIKSHGELARFYFQ